MGVIAETCDQKPSLDPSFLCAEIDDTGPGIAADHIDRLFQSFFSTKRGGMGIGLSICRSIIEAQNLGAGNGARFRFTLPTSAPSPGIQRHAEESHQPLQADVDQAKHNRNISHEI
jgi:signal transduction histidine kinase